MSVGLIIYIDYEVNLSSFISCSLACLPFGRVNMSALGGPPRVAGCDVCPCVQAVTCVCAHAIACHRYSAAFSATEASRWEFLNSTELQWGNARRERSNKWIIKNLNKMNLIPYRLRGILQVQSAPFISFVSVPNYCLHAVSYTHLRAHETS